MPVTLTLMAVSALLRPPPHYHHLRGTPSLLRKTGPPRAAVACGPRVKICAVGKPNRDSAWLQQAAAEYVDRLRGVLQVETAFVRDDTALLSSVERCAAAGETAIVLDELGQRLSSREFSELLYDGLEKGGSRISFFIGGVRQRSRATHADISHIRHRISPREKDAPTTGFLPAANARFVSCARRGVAHTG